jgi:acyl-coenzyme A thioesterase PaaI-like protein
VTVVLPAADTGPEAMLRIGELTVEDGVYRGAMPVGPWLAVERRTPAGAVAVLADDLLAYAIAEDLPSGQWSVSTEITLDVLRPLPTSGRLFVKGERAGFDDQSGFATGTVKDESGRLLALCSQRARFVRAPDGLVEEGTWGGPPRPGDLERLLGVRADVPMVTTDVLANEADHLHGGISMFASDLVASSLAPGLVTASIHVVYTRGIPIGSEVTWRASVRHPGRSLTVVDVDGVVDGAVSTTARVVLQPPARAD